MPRVTLLLTGCFVVLLAGCGSSSSTVSGTITFDGKPLNSGFVLFQPSQGTVQSANIQPDGPEAFDLKSVFIPRKYGDVATSGLTYEVKPGSQTHDIQLQQ